VNGLLVHAARPARIVVDLGLRIAGRYVLLDEVSPPFAASRLITFDPLPITSRCCTTLRSYWNLTAFSALWTSKIVGLLSRDDSV
jgi:hypothetical protein